VNVIALVGPDGVLLVDTGFDKNPVNGFINSPAAIKEELKKIGNDNIKFIIDTHTDSDHAFGNAELGQNATIIAHQLGRERLLAIRQFPGQGLPNLTFQDSLRLFFNNEEIDVFYLPGHTNHDIVVHFKNAKIVCVGDLIIPDSFGSISPTGNVHSLIKAMDVLYNRFADDVTFVAGHDRNLQKKDLPPYKDMIEKTLAVIEKEIKKGKSLEQMQKDDILKSWRKWDGVLFRELNANGWTTMIYTNIIKKLKPSAAEKLGEMVRKSGYAPAKNEINVLLSRKTKYYFVEAEFNILGYNLINEGKLNDAIEVFKITVGLYPASWNAYDSLGEAYALAGSKELAIENYDKSLKLNPNSPSGIQALKQLKVKTN
jgi:cyclase